MTEQSTGNVRLTVEPTTRQSESGHGFADLFESFKDRSRRSRAAEGFLGILAVSAFAFDEGEKPGEDFVLTGEGDGGEQSGAEPGVVCFREGLPRTARKLLRCCSALRSLASQVRGSVAQRFEGCRQLFDAGRSGRCGHGQ